MEVVWRDGLTFISVERDGSCFFLFCFVFFTRDLNCLVSRRNTSPGECECSALSTTKAPVANPREGCFWRLFFPWGRHCSGDGTGGVDGLMLTRQHQPVSSASWCSCPGPGHQREVCTRGAGVGVVCGLVIFSHLTLFSPADPGWASGKGGWVCTSGSPVDGQ